MIIDFTIVMKIHTLHYPSIPTISSGTHRNDNSFHHHYEATPTCNCLIPSISSGTHKNYNSFHQLREETAPTATVSEEGEVLSRNPTF